MMNEIEVTAKTLEEAKALAAEKLGADMDKITFEVLEEGKKGFLGIGAVDAKVKASLPLPEGVINALGLINQLIANMGIEGLTVGTKAGEGENADDTVITVDGEGAGVLIGHHGETMDALQYLCNLSANRAKGKDSHPRIILDVESYRAKREETLRALARRNASKVLKEKKSVVLEPMNAYERRIIHSEVQHIAGVSTNSIGADEHRRVVLFLDDSKQ